MADSSVFVFEIQQEGQPARTERLSLDVIKIGSHAKSHLCLNDPDVSRVHAVLERRGDEVFLIDLGSGRGTMVNGERINKRQLFSGDRITVGSTEVVFRIGAAREEAAIAAAQASGVAGAAVRRGSRTPDSALYSRRFLSRPASTDGSVEIAVLANDFVIYDEIFNPPKNIVLGSEAGCTFPLEHPSMGSTPFTLVSAEGGEPQLHLNAEMQGELYVGTDRYTIAEAFEQGVVKGGKRGSVRLAQDTRARLVFGDVQVFLHRSSKPALVLPPYIGAIAPVLVFFGVSFLLHALFMALIFWYPSGVGDFDNDRFDPNNRFVQMVIEEPIEEQIEEPDWLEEDEGQDDGAEGEEGRAGDEREENEDSRMAVEGDNTEAPTELARAEARLEALQTGALAVLTNVGPSSIFGSEASGYDDLTAIGGVGTADQLGASYGMGGLGQYGGGLSAGGGRGGSGFGSGPIAVRGRASNEQVGHELRDISDRSERRVSVRPGNPSIRGQLDRSIIQRVIRQHRREIRACYESALQRDPDLDGRVVVAFVIDPSGSVAGSRIESSTIGNSSVENCVATRVRRWRFPEPRGGGTVRVSYPFVFTADGN